MVGSVVDFVTTQAAYGRCNDLRDRGPARRDGPARDPDGCSWPSSMVVYGRGAYSCSGHGWPPPAAAAGLRPTGPSHSGRFEPRCERCGERCHLAGPAEAPALGRATSAATKLAQEHIAGSWPGLRRARVAPALTQRVRSLAFPATRRTRVGLVLPLFPRGRPRPRSSKTAQLGRTRARRDVAGASRQPAIEAVGGPARPRRSGALPPKHVGIGVNPAHRCCQPFFLRLAAAYYSAGRVPLSPGSTRLGYARHVTLSS